MSESIVPVCFAPVRTALRRQLLAIVFCALAAGSLMASSTIYDGIVVSVEEVVRRERGKEVRTLEIRIRVRCSPYSSETVHTRIMTHRDGTYQLQQRRLTDFKSFFVDEVPVSHDQMAAVIKPGMRVTTFENRANWYFLRVETRNPESQMGTLTALDGDQATVSRPQHGYAEQRIMEASDRNGAGARRTEEDGRTIFDDEYFPPFDTTFSLPSDTEVIAADGAVTDLSTLPSHVGAPVFVQPARERQRVEVIPAGRGDWASVLDNDSFLGGHRQLRYSSLVVMRSRQFDYREMVTKPPHSEREVRPQQTKVFDGYLLAGWREPGPITIPIYHKGEWNLVDGMYSNRYNFRHLLLQPGRLVVATSRRRRLTPDALNYSSEMPAGWGVITAINENTVTVQAPEIDGVPVRGEQHITIADDAEFVHLGQALGRDRALTVGALIQVYQPRPTRVYLDGPRQPAPKR